MEISPKMKSSPFGKLDPGDLCIAHDDTGSYAALAVQDPQSGGNWALILGPASKDAPIVPVVTNFPHGLAVASFARQFTLCLPCTIEPWLDREPAPDKKCVVLTEDKIYVRAVFSFGPGGRRIYVCLNDGRILVDGSGSFDHPAARSPAVYATRWTLVTIEREPREILSFS
jgi:hypothetical protein